MELALPITAQTFVVEATVAEDGSLHLNNLMPNLRPGEKVMLTISPISETKEENANPLLGTVTRYEDPFGPAAPLEEWEALRGC